MVIGSLILLATLPLGAQSLTSEQWRADLVFLARELPARHINAFKQVTTADFQKEVLALDSRIPQLAEIRIRAEILKLVASIGDGHTRVQSQGRPDALHTLPLGLYWFKDGIYVVSAAEAYGKLVGGRLERVGTMSVEDACRALTPLVAHENHAELRLMLPGRLVTPELLFTEGVTDSPDSAHVEVTAPTGELVSMNVRPLASGETPKVVSAFSGEAPLHRKNATTPYWVTTIDNGSTVYFEYNQCVNDPKQPFSTFRGQLREMLAQNGVRRLIVDLRHNGGGNSAILDPWIAEVRNSPLNAKGKLFVIIGRSTFSSAILNALRFRNTTAAILVGEPTAGKPNHFGEVKTFELPNSHVQVSYSTKYFKDSKEDTDSLMPDVLAEPTFRDYLDGVDPVLKAIPR